MIKTIITVILLVLSQSAQAELYMELSVENGGDALISSPSYSVNAGSGVKLAIGVQKVVGEEGETLSLSLGRMSDFIDANDGIDGKAEINTHTVDAIYSIRRGHHRFGFGGSYHIGPIYEENIAGLPPVEIKFDDALGLILQYSYAWQPGPGFQIGARYTLMDYKASGLSLNADSYGIFISNGF
jgi:hypothetical protein